MHEKPREALPQEIERKFKVKFLPENLDRKSGVIIEQGYLPDGRRFRRKGDKYYLTIKKGVGLVRSEIESEISQAEFDEIWPDTAGVRISKVRYKISLPEGLIAELDEFMGELSGHMVVEVEFPNIAVAQSFEPPEWFDEDVTEDETFGNIELAKHGWPK